MCKILTKMLLCKFSYFIIFLHTISSKVVQQPETINIQEKSCTKTFLTNILIENSLLVSTCKTHSLKGILI